MAVMDIGDIDLDTRTDEILLAASNHDLGKLKPFLRVPGAASVQDPETGRTPLHVAIAACGVAPLHKASTSIEAPSDSTSDRLRSQSHEAIPAEEENEDEEVDIEKAKAIVKELFLSGAIWNDLDGGNETPGCLAWRLGQKELYELVVEAGVRAELLLNLMGGYEPLADGDEGEWEEEDEEEKEGGKEEKEVVSGNEGEDLEEENTVEGGDRSRKGDPMELQEATNPNGLAITRNTAQQSPTEHQAPSHIGEAADVNSKAFLSSNLAFTPTALIDASSNGVMMAWETAIMERTCALLAPTSGLRILNVGFGLGIIDRLFAATSPSAHHIVEAHADVLAALHSDVALGFGAEWTARSPGKNVVHSGRWQEVMPRLLAAGEVFDAIYFDTFGEPYGELKRFFSEYAVRLLDRSGRFGFFNGLGADRRVCHDVYCRVVELDLCESGLDVEWTDVPIDLGQGLEKEGEGVWEGIRRRYWTLEKYRLPVCTFIR